MCRSSISLLTEEDDLPLRRELSHKIIPVLLPNCLLHFSLFSGKGLKSGLSVAQILAKAGSCLSIRLVWQWLRVWRCPSLSIDSLVAQTVKRLPVMWETWVQSLGREDPLEKEMATHSTKISRKFHGWRSLVGYSPWGHKELDTAEWLSLHFTGI